MWKKVVTKKFPSSLSREAGKLKCSCILVCPLDVHSPGAPQLDASVFTPPPKQKPDIKVLSCCTTMFSYQNHSSIVVIALHTRCIPWHCACTCPREGLEQICSSQIYLHTLPCFCAKIAWHWWCHHPPCTNTTVIRTWQSCVYVLTCVVSFSFAKCTGLMSSWL